MMQSLADLPPIVIADLFGMSVANEVCPYATEPFLMSEH